MDHDQPTGFSSKPPQPAKAKLTRFPPWAKPAVHAGDTHWPLPQMEFKKIPYKKKAQTKQTVASCIQEKDSFCLLQTRPQVTSTSTDKLCPLCKCIPEDMQHFLGCSHLSRKPAFQELQQQILKLHQKHNCKPTVHQILWQGITSILLQHNLTESRAQYTHQHLSLFQAQECIGWMQLLNG